MERFKQGLARLALVATTLSMVMTGFVGTAHAAAITTNSDILSNNQVSQTAVTHNISYVTVTAATTKCIKYTFDTGANLTGTNANVSVDFSNVSGGNQVTAGTIVYTTGASGNVKVPFNGTLDAGRIITATIGSITNSSTAGSSYTVLIDLYSDTTCTTGVTDTNSSSLTYSLVNDRVTQNVTVMQALQWTLSGNTTHQYMVDPVNNPTDSQSNSMTVRTNADAYSVYIHGTAMTHTSGGDTSTVLSTNFAGTDGTPAVINWNGSTGNRGWGYNIGSVSGSTKSAYSAGEFAAFQTSGTSNNTVMTLATPVGNTANSATITYKVGADWNTEAGSYSSITDYVVTPTYQ